MKTENIALFKRFCRVNGINQMFVGMYRQFHFPESPDDIEVYLAKVDAKDVILNAFKFPKDLKTFGAEFWMDVALKWETTMKNATENGYYERCTKCKTMTKERAERPLGKASKHDSARTDTIKVTESEPQVAPEPKAEPKPEPKPVVEQRPRPTEEQMAINGFNYFEATKEPKQRLSSNEITITTRSGFRITFNKIISAQIFKSNLKTIRFGVKDNELYIVFSNDVNGLPWRKNSCNVVLSSKELVVKIMDFLKISGMYEVLEISKNLANNNTYMTFKVSKIKKNENKSSNMVFM